MKKYHLLLSLLFLLLQTATAQNPFITNYTIADGLVSNNVYCSCQDKNGFVWFGTDAGVVRFDGSNFVNYTEDDGLSGDIVVRIQEDFSGRLWFFNRNGSTNYYYKNKIYNKDNAPFLDELTTNFFLFGFFQDKDSTLYFYNFLSEVFAVKNNTLIDYIYYEFNNKEDIGLLYFNKSADNKFLLRTALGEYKFNKIDDNIKLHKQTFRSLRVFKKSANENYVLDRTGNIHLLHDSNILRKEILQSKTLLVNSIVEDKDGFLWVSTFDKGIYCYSGDSIILHLDIKTAQNLIFDNENNIWAVSNIDGIYKINRDILKYKFVGKNKFDNEGITDLAKSNQEGVWATNGKSLFYILNNKVFNRKIMIEGDILSNITQLRNNTIILSGSGVKIHAIENVIVKKNNIDFDSYKLLNYRVKKIAIDTSESLMHSYVNDLLIAINLKDLSDVSIIKFKRGRIYNIFNDNRNKLIVNTAKNYTVTDTIFPEPLYQQFNGQIIVSHLIMDNENELFNISKNRLYLLNNNKFLDLTSQFKSQIDYTIKDMIYDGSTLFFFTNRTVYFISNPLKILAGKPLELNRLNIEFNNINDLYCQDSTLYVASDDGLTFIPIEECVNAQVLPTKPYFYKISIDDENYDLSLRSVEFKNQKRLSIEFSSLNYSSIPSNYSYILEGVDKDWINGNETRVVYLNLAPGNYTFKLKSRKNREDYSEIIELPIIVRPTIYQRTITKILFVLIFFFLIFLIIRYRYRRKTKQKETEHLLTTLENKALQSMMNPHFIFNALGSIQGFLLQNKSVEAGTYLSQFARLIRQNMNSLKSNYICIDDEIERLRNYVELEKLRMNNKFNYQIEVDDKIDSYDVCIPSMIIQPFVENAIWHGIASIESDGLVKITFKFIDEKSIEVLVEDNGIGIEDTKTFSESGHGLNMGVTLTKKRLKLIGEQQGVNSEIITKNITPGADHAGTQIKIIVPIVDGNT